ncbi:MAG TPA: acyl-CoA dehydrogenase family protein [Caulobacteraceae bacterium]|nr:acyl-CoA dehydrogenase family protein [Caulobacteraceae bacterium]
MADFGGDVEAFRADARAWLTANFPQSLKTEGGRRAGGGDAKLWKQRMADQGWGAPTWPKAYGGGGLSRQEARALAEEMAKLGAYNPIGGLGIMSIGPTILELGTEEQKARHLPHIAHGEYEWCQGYSEPGAGSDLASLQTRCEDKGDHWLVNGQKIWTSVANLADWCFCLVRTDFGAKKHEGISCLLINMKDPGVETRPIRLINGDSPFCETFFTDVKARKDDIIGPLNGGWTIAKRLLQFERDNISIGLGGGTLTGPASSMGVEDFAKRYVGLDSGGRLADADLRGRLAAHKMESQAFQLTLRRAADEAKSNQGPSNAASIMKYAGAKIAQDRAELIVEALGANGLGWEGEGFEPQELAQVRGWLRTKANSIEGGSSEINLNVVSKRVLGLPDPK